LQKQFEIHGLDHDIFTNDYGIDDEALKTLGIKKENSKKDCYIVTYVDTSDTSDPLGHI